MVISDREKVKDILKKVNYYRFTGYALQYRKDPSGSDYIEGTIRMHLMTSIMMKIIFIIYSSKMSLWVIMELMSFSNMSKLYSSMYYSEKDAIAGMVGVGKDTLENHLHCLSVLRNKCAHAARMYNTDFNPPAKFTTTFLRKRPEIKNNSFIIYYKHKICNDY